MKSFKDMFLPCKDKGGFLFTIPIGLSIFEYDTDDLLERTKHLNQCKGLIHMPTPSSENQQPLAQQFGPPNFKAL